ncbi:MAG: Eco57I restriction-modification methylase domain-containing protein [Thermoplasmataceae archaeon]
MYQSDKEKLSSYLSDISKLYADINTEEPNFLKYLENEEAIEYVKGLKSTKPETLLSDKLFKPVIKLTGVTSLPEARVGEGWVDFVLASSNSMGFPVALELKSLHNKSGQMNSLDFVIDGMKNEFRKRNSNQIIKYIVGQNGVEYVILTNLKDVYIYDKSCVIDFDPVAKETFNEFIEGIASTKNISDYLKRKTQEVTRHDLDKLFIRDLKKWYGYLQELEWKDDPKTSSVLLLNKLIFALTLEDFIIIDYRYTWNSFATAYNKWKTKGARKVLEVFFHDLDDFLYEYFDTELFVSSSNILSKLVSNKENYAKALEVIKRVAGFDDQVKAFSEGLYSYSFRLIDEDVFGKSYETFLAENRKDSGIYYTPKEMTKHMSNTVVVELFYDLAEDIIKSIDNNDFDRAMAITTKLVSLGIIDPACGSGPFLIGVLREIYQVYLGLTERTNWVQNQFKANSLFLPRDIEHKIEKTKQIREKLGINGDKIQRELLSKIILRHIFGVDIDQTALNVAKVNLWKEAVKLNPESFYYQELPEEENHILPDLELNFINGDSVVTLPDDKVIDIMQREFKDEIVEMINLHMEYLENPTRSDITGIINSKKELIRTKLMEEFEKAYPPKGNPLFFPLEYFFFYFDENGLPLEEERRGFAGVIGNPPWNNLKPNKKEFAAKHPEIFGEGISKYSISGKEFEKIFEAKLKEPEVRSLWVSNVSSFETLSKFISSNRLLQYSGDFSLQKVFLEKFIRLSNRAFSILIPSNFHTDEGTKLLRKEIMDNWEISELISFENRGKVWFSDIDSRFKFDMLTVSKERLGAPFKAKFYVTKWDDIESAFDYPVELIEKLSPGVLGITEFRSEDDIAIISKIRGNHKLLMETGIKLRRELDETNDKDIFLETSEGLILYEGKMIYQYQNNFGENTYWVNEKIGRERLTGRSINRITNKLGPLLSNNIKEIIKNSIENHEIKMDYETERLVFRDVASSTNERTLISTVVPPRVFLANTLVYLEPFEFEQVGEKVSQTPVKHNILYIEALFNSFVLDYYVRQRVTSHLNFFFVYELPVPEVDQELESTIVYIAKKLMNNNENESRANIEAIIARDVFKLSKEEMKHILNSFVYGNIDEELTKMILDLM